MEHYNNIDKQLQKLRDINDEAYKKHKFYDDEYEAELEEGFEIHQDLLDKLKETAEDLKNKVDAYEAFVVFCVKKKVDLTNHWRRLGFSQEEIQKMALQKE